ncbi:hypothetical protein DEU56DRAFT_69287 [Suillus clintonianus]|uniref:uncharacterized protein n=1 Tax=Suillus clintonianus TaxID=1904413 RepID=UPI001B872B02|nr:uncharacterized protein DEU56DRAFT_69287 [Suillus clintonianus]KAG2122774.1 hypothetical protein DEU56DRAFT_69287 [Suillus clintonianus]
MGRTRTKAKKSALNVTNSSQSSSSSATPAISAILDKAQVLIVQCDFPLARKFIERVLAREDGSVNEKNQAREMMGVVLLETGEVDEARELFLTLLPPHPTAPTPPPPSAHLYLAQLSADPNTALKHYQAAIDILQTQLKGKASSPIQEDEQDGEDEVKSNIVRAYLGMVEIWMDPEYDLCFDPAASSTCDSLLANALHIDSYNLEALQCLASVRLSQEKTDEALAALLTFPLSSPDAPPARNQALVAALPLSVRLARAKLLLECGAYHDALDVLENVLASDDSSVEGWYLMGWGWWLVAERRKEGGEVEGSEGLTWEDIARDSRDCLETCQTLHESQSDPDTPILEHVQELLGTLDALGIKSSPVQDDEEGDGDDWEDASDDEDVEMS